MKLNIKRTICVGFAFFLICTFWQAYDTIIPKMLTDRFGLSQTVSGFIMAIDNILALFMLPLFGVISDKCRSKFGKRTPFILFGTIAAVLAIVALAFVSQSQLDRIDVKELDSAEARAKIYATMSGEDIIAPSGEVFKVNEKLSQDEFAAIKSIDVDGKATDDYTNIVVPARQAYVKQNVTSNNIGVLAFFILILLVLLISMATFRTPAVALMPDVTVKPLRSKANAIINLMGTIGGSIVLALGIVLGTGKTQNTFMSYNGYFFIIGGIMLVCLCVFMITVREPRFVSDMNETSKRLGLDTDDEEITQKAEKTSKESQKAFDPKFISLILILSSVVFWFAGYNAVTSKYSVYAGNVLNLDYNSTLLVANVAALVSYIPVGIVASRIGRKKAIIAGVIILGVSFGTAAFLDNGTPLPVMMVIFSLAGIGWATINVNSFPMVVELAEGNNVGKYTGFYYTASMAAQTLTPIVSGWLMDRFGMKVLFPYSAVFVGLALITMLFVRHGDSKPIAKSAIEALGEIDD